MTSEQETQGLPETIRENLPNPDAYRGVLVIYAIDDEINIKARGLTPRQVVQICGKLILELFK